VVTKSRQLVNIGALVVNRDINKGTTNFILTLMALAGFDLCLKRVSGLVLILDKGESL
jgi:hypothetical protein